MQPGDQHGRQPRGSLCSGIDEAGASGGLTLAGGQPVPSLNAFKVKKAEASKRCPDSGRSAGAYSPLGA